MQNKIPHFPKIYPAKALALHAQISIAMALQKWGPFSPLEFLYFADTLVLYLPKKEESLHSSPGRVMESMLYAAKMMVAGSIRLNIPVRGAIAYGNGLVCRDPLYFIGEPFAEAHALEQDQEWSGIALCKSAAQHVDEHKLRVVEWDVPLKKDKRERLLVVDWPPAIVGPLRTVFDDDLTGYQHESPDWDACFAGSSSDVQRKRQNTLEFFDARHRSGAEGVGPEQSKYVSGWQELYRLSRSGHFGSIK